MNKGYFGICRVSTINQKDNNSLSNQKKQIQTYCKNNGINLIGIIEEVESGSKGLERKGIKELQSYIEDGIVLRNHTSNSQIHTMLKHSPPIKIIAPGRVYRNEDISVRSYCLFHQVEGLYIDKQITFSDLKGVLDYFAKKFFGIKVKTRFRPSYFPFTEPSAEMDVSCIFCNNIGCNICKNTGWLEILGCGMVDPEVFKSVNIDYKIWSGYAFGMGIERMTMLRYGIEDIRIFYEGDIRFLKQFR